MAEASELSAGMYILYRDEPLKVVRKEIVTFGTHCHSKLKIMTQGLQGKGEKVLTMAHTDKVEILDITRKGGTVLAKVGNKVQIMDSHSYETVDADADPNILAELNEGDEVTFVSYSGKTIILEKRAKKTE
jgi:translation initiation factor 5A